MRENLRERIKTNLLTQDTEYLLDIWQNGDVDEWEKEVFEIVKEILLDRLGYVPPQSVEKQASQIVDRVKEYIESKELNKALSECETAIQLNPDSAIAHNYLGEIYDEMGQLENAIINYQKAIELDPELKDAWENMLSAESELEDEFVESIAKQHLDNALDFAHSDEPQKALAECETAKPMMPSLAIAHNYLGLILQTLDQLEPAIDSYLKAIQLNPRFYAARENLANARVILEEEQYIRAANFVPDNTKEIDETNTEFDEPLLIAEGEPIPGWMYLDANAFFLTGWAGHRYRPGRSGYDPLETDFELAHMEGVIIRRLITLKFRTRNLFYLLVMAFMGILFSLYGAAPFILGNLEGLMVGIISSPYLMVGIALLMNVYSSLRLEKPDEYEDNGYTFF